VIEVVLTPKVFSKDDHDEFSGIKRGQASKRRWEMEMDYEGRDTVAYNGLQNEGTTCYMNSLLQTLYTLGRFRKAIY